MTGTIRCRPYLLWLERTPIGRPMGLEIRATLAQVRVPDLEDSSLHASRRRTSARSRH